MVLLFFLGGQFWIHTFILASTHCSFFYTQSSKIVLSSSSETGSLWPVCVELFQHKLVTSLHYWLHCVNAILARMFSPKVESSCMKVFFWDRGTVLLLFECCITRFLLLHGKQDICTWNSDLLKDRKSQDWQGERRKVIETRRTRARYWENKSESWEKKREVVAEDWLIQIVKLMYDRTDWCCLSDTSELNVFRRKQITAETVLHLASCTKCKRVYFQMREQDRICVWGYKGHHISACPTLYSKQPSKILYCIFLRAKSYISNIIHIYAYQSQTLALRQQLYLNKLLHHQNIYLLFRSWCSCLTCCPNINKKHHAFIMFCHCQ